MRTCHSAECSQVTETKDDSKEAEDTQLTAEEMTYYVLEQDSYAIWLCWFRIFYSVQGTLYILRSTWVVGAARATRVQASDNLGG